MKLQKRIVGTVSGVAALLSCAGMAEQAGAQCTSFAGINQSSGAAIVPGTVNIGNAGDDVVSSVALPFPVMLYGVNYNSCMVSSNGNAQFTSSANAYTNECLPTSTFGVAILAHWDDLRTDGAAGGIFTSTSGEAPNRIFNIEWRPVYYNANTTLLNFEVRLYEDGSKVDVIYGTNVQGGVGATVGIQNGTTTFTQFECNSGGITAGTKLSFVCGNGPTTPLGNGSATPNQVYNCTTGATSLLSVLVNPGLNPTSTDLGVTADLSAINGSAAQALYDDATHGDATAGDNRFSYMATISSSVTTGVKTLPFSITDAQSRSASGNMSLNVNACPTSGPDVYVGTVTDMANWTSSGPVDVDPGAGVLNVCAYSVGTDACNLGDVPVLWIDNTNHPGYNTNEHPVIAQNMFRLKDGRFEQIGQSWLKHGFTSTNSNTCSTCTPPPFGGDQLGVNCSDAYGSGLNGSQGSMGPRYQVNGTTGAYPYPPANPAFNATIGKRLQVYASDVNPADNPGAAYFVDTHYVTADDARWTAGVTPATNGLNNTSYRAIAISSTTAVPTFVGNTVRFKAAIDAWQAADPTVQLANADYLDQSLSPAGITARFCTACKVTSLGGGQWRYEYAVYNLNADRCGGSFSVPIDTSATVTNVGFHGVFEHSGAPYPNTALNPDNWVGGKVGGQVVWNCPEAYNAAVGGDNGNALRWGTMYNFRFDTNVAPSAGAVTVGLYKPATATNTATSASATLSVPVTPCGTADFDGDGDTGTDADIEAFFACLGGTCCPTCFPGGSDFNMDGDSGTDADIESFFRVLGGGHC